MAHQAIRVLLGCRVDGRLDFVIESGGAVRLPTSLKEPLPVSSASDPSLVDRSYQLAYKTAYQMMRMYWAVRRPQTHGALVTLWNEGEILLVQNSYVSYRCIPGGYIAAGETGRQAAVRELREEVGVRIDAEQLQPVLDEVNDWEGKRDHVEIFSLELSKRPQIQIDHREVIDAGWFSVERALEMELFPPLRRVLQAR